MYICPFLVEGGAEGICTCTEEHKIKYEYHVEQKQISLFAQGKVVICMLNENNPVSIITFLIYILCRSNPSSLKCISDQKKKLISKKKIPGYKHISDLMSATFEPPVKLIKETSASVGLDVHEIEYNDSEIGSVLINSGVQTDTIDSDSDDEAVKSKNLVQYTTYKLEKRKRKLEREIDTQKEKLKIISTKIGYYSIRNVNKRDEKSKQNTKLISELRRTVRKQNVIVNEV
jgi:hypothetical protein